MPKGTTNMLWQRTNEGVCAAPFEAADGIVEFDLAEQSSASCARKFLTLYLR
jgi:hypothetical protein